MATTSCTIPITVLREAPYNIPWGGGIYAKVQAFNSYGDSFFSNDGKGAIIFIEAGRPYDLIENIELRTSTQLSISWTASADTGGTPVISYRVSYDQGTSDWTILASDVEQTYYTATNLQYGTTYSFKVESLTSYSYSPESIPISLLCAAAPLTIEMPLTMI